MARIEPLLDNDFHSGLKMKKGARNMRILTRAQWTRHTRCRSYDSPGFDRNILNFSVVIQRSLLSGVFEHWGFGNDQINAPCYTKKR